MTRYRITYASHQERGQVIEVADFKAAYTVAKDQIADYRTDQDTRCAGWEITKIEQVDDATPLAEYTDD